jgi:hypothetical protein
MRARAAAAVVGAILMLGGGPSGLPLHAQGQRAPFASPLPGDPPPQMRPYGTSAGCSEEPLAFHRCALEKMKTFTPPKTADGHPDFTGIWSRIVIRNMENIEEHGETIDTSGGTSAIIDPADRKIPYQPWAAAKRDQMFSRYVNPLALCTPMGTPKQAYGPGTFRVVETPSAVFMLADFAHEHRVIQTDGRPHVGTSIHLFEGDSRGRWEGNTLVVDVTNQRDSQWFDAVGNFFSDSVHVVERWTMIDKDVIHYEATITDPKVFTRPWTIVTGWKRSNDSEIWENACWEGVQEDMDHLSFGLKQYPGALGN